MRSFMLGKRRWIQGTGGGAWQCRSRTKSPVFWLGFAGPDARDVQSGGLDSPAGFAHPCTRRMLHKLILFWFGLVHDWGYGGIALLMAMESSIFPVPSEVVIPPAAFWATQGKLNFWGVVAAGTAGSWVGSAVTYWLSLKLGRLAVVRWGRYFFISEAKLLRAERFVHRYEAGGIFFARLLPVVRHLISIPAGLIGMNFRVFSLMTLLGSFIWCTILAWFGKRVSEQHPDLIDDPTKLVHAIKTESLPIILAVAVLCILYVVVIRLTGQKQGEDAAAA